MLPTNGRWDKRVDTAGMPWLRPNLNGFASRRIEAVGRWDYDGVAYGAVRARAIAFTKDALYCIDGGEAKGKKGKYGQLTRVPLRPDGAPAEDASWKVRTMHHDGKREHNNVVITSLVVAGKTIFLAGHEKEKEPSFVHAYAAADGKKLGQWMLPAPPVRNGLIAASGRLFVSLESGALLCLAP
jgi:hypothetical protein